MQGKGWRHPGLTRAQPSVRDLEGVSRESVILAFVLWALTEPSAKRQTPTLGVSDQKATLGDYSASLWL